MKSTKLLLFGIVFLSISLLSFGQAEKGSLFVSSNTNMSLVYSIESSSFELEYNPKLGKMIFDGFVFGAGVNLELGKDVAARFPYLDEENAWALQLAAGPFARYYIGKAKVRPFVDASIVAGPFNFKYTGSYGPINGTVLFMRMKYSMGISVFLNEKFSLEFDGNYNYSLIFSDSGITSSNLLGTNLGFSLFFLR